MSGIEMRISPGSTVSCFPAGSRTATTSARGPSPGGLRSSRRSPAFVARGGFVLGSCNGFQILCEAGLLPGALVRNECLQYRCQSTYLITDNVETPFTRALRPGQVLKMPISHGEGRYYAEAEVLRQLRDSGQIVFRYCTEDGRVTKDANPNGSMQNIAGIVSEGGTVLGLMPHPERAAESELGGTDGTLIFHSLLGSLVEDGSFLKR